MPQIGLSDVISPEEPFIVILIKASFLQASLLSPLSQASIEVIDLLPESPWTFARAASPLKKQADTGVLLSDSQRGPGRQAGPRGMDEGSPETPGGSPWGRYNSGGGNHQRHLGWADTQAAGCPSLPATPRPLPSPEPGTQASFARTSLPDVGRR